MTRKSLWRARALAWSCVLAFPLKAHALNFGGQLRLRYESMSLSQYAPPAGRPALDQFSLRTRLGAGGSPAEGVRVFVNIQDSRVAGSEASVSANSKNVDLHEAWLEMTGLWALPLDLKAGRQELIYGDQRMISTLDWDASGRAWDGLRLRWKKDLWQADFFSAVTREAAGPKQDEVFTGLYATLQAAPEHELDFYLLSRTSAAVNSGNLRERSLGMRMKGRREAWDYSAETACQFGSKGGKNLRAWALAATAGYKLDSKFSPRIGLEYDFASGDSDPSDATSGTFEPPYPFGHTYQGLADVFSWKNAHDLALRTSAAPREGWTVALDLHHFLLASSKDAWYGPSNAAITRDATGSAGKTVGHELDFHVKTAVRKAVKLWFGYSRFFAGPYVARTVGGRDKDWAFFQATVDF
ncbi:MAG: alginate export family protein [Elusimicrobia bacterium]|nr:alginate export family protein [Elusimicrobiota bacterium]